MFESGKGGRLIQNLTIEKGKENKQILKSSGCVVPYLSVQIFQFWFYKAVYKLEC